MAMRFENGIVATLGDDGRVLHGGSVVVDGEHVVAIGDSAAMKAAHPDAESVDCSGKLVLPGFICAHHHLYSTMARGMAPPGEPASNFVEVLERLWWKLDMALSEDDVALSARIPMVECIRNGTTTIIDHHASPSCRDGSLDIIEEAVREAGIRASICYEISDRNMRGGGLGESERFARKHRQTDGQIAAMVGMHASFTVSNMTVASAVGSGRARQWSATSGSAKTAKAARQACRLWTIC